MVKKCDKKCSSLQHSIGWKVVQNQQYQRCQTQPARRAIKKMSPSNAVNQKCWNIAIVSFATLQIAIVKETKYHQPMICSGQRSLIVKTIFGPRDIITTTYIGILTRLGRFAPWIYQRGASAQRANRIAIPCNWDIHMANSVYWGTFFHTIIPETFRNFAHL